MDIQKLTAERILLFDGALGTMLQARGLPAGGIPEHYNITHPGIVRDIHKEYVQAGADVISTNTFQANPYKIHGQYSIEAIIDAGVKLARQSGARFVALDVGPLGQLMEPMGTLRFEEAYDAYRQVVELGAAAGADCILFETISDLYEARAGILAAKENTNLPVICTMTFQEDGRTFVGCDPQSTVFTLQALGVDALGVNCSLGPRELAPIVEQMLPYTKVPFLLQSNAGLPEMHRGETVYRIAPEEFAQAELALVQQGVRMVGGCCGTTPDCIRQLHQHTHKLTPIQHPTRQVTALCSGSRSVILDDGVAMIGERLNPTGKKKLKAALQQGQMDVVIAEAIDQSEAGSDILDVNVGLPDLDEAAMMQRVIREVQGVSALPLQIDSSDPAAVEAGVRVYNGKPLINSVNGKKESMDQIFPIAQKYGAAVVALALDENGIPSTAEGRLAVAEKIVKTAQTYGIAPEDIVVDCLVLTASAQQEQVKETLRAVALVKEKLGVKTVLGVSNVSFGLPARDLVNATFLAAALGAGLDAAIVNPLSSRYQEVFDAFRVLNAQDKDATHFVQQYGSQPLAPTQSAASAAAEDVALKDIIIQGRRGESAGKVRQMLESISALEIIDEHFVPALDEVGRRFESGALFLPQLMQSAEAVKNGFDVLKAHMEENGEKTQSRGKILLATVKNDIHDIGKNIVKMMLENYGYDVIDLGKDVPTETIIAAMEEQDIQLVGLSALMTTTVRSMKDTIAAVRKRGLDSTFVVGGAVLNEEYASFVGADHYAHDAMDTVNIANAFFQQDKSVVKKGEIANE